MKIAIIGAGLSGLTAGRILAKAGHDVVLFEKSRGYGGRLATRRKQNGSPVKIDHGAPYLAGTTDEFKSFLNELEEHGLVAPWTETVSGYSDGQILPELPGRERQPYYTATQGMNSVGKYMSRLVDMYPEENVGGITHVGGSRIKKSPWIINSSSINVFEADAVIIATPAIQAYGLVATAQDEYELRKMITLLDDISYTSTISLMAGYGRRESPEWKAIVCDHPIVAWLCNEGTKRDFSGDVYLVAHTTDRFAREMTESDDSEEADKHIIKAMDEILGNWAGRPEWHQSHLWRYHQPRKSLDIPFLESDDELAPLALVGDYFQGKSMEAAYLSGFRLGMHWVEKFS
ncbi:MAG: FAD-dependent oxidoreductase [Cyclonatronaceae bacterium]